MENIEGGQSVLDVRKVKVLFGDVEYCKSGRSRALCSFGIAIWRTGFPVRKVMVLFCVVRNSKVRLWYCVVRLGSVMSRYSISRTIKYCRCGGIV